MLQIVTSNHDVISYVVQTGDLLNQSESLNRPAFEKHCWSIRSQSIDRQPYMYDRSCAVYILTGSSVDVN